MRIHIVDGGGPTALGAALEASPFSPELQAAMWKELLDTARFPRVDHGLFKCELVTAPSARHEIAGFREGDLIAHLGVGSAGEILIAALRAASQKAIVEHVTHENAPSVIVERQL